MKKMIVTRLSVVAGVCAAIMLIQPPCIYKRIFSVPCPGCGMTRAAHALLHFDFKAALGYNPIIFLTPVIIWIIVTDGHMLKGEKINKLILIFVMVSLIIIYIIKLIQGGYINVL